MSDRTQHLKDQIGYYQNRINLVDSKCGTLIAIQAAILAVVTFATDKVFLNDLSLRQYGYAIIAFTALIVSIIVIHLIRTIRPTHRLFDRDTENKEHPFMENKLGIMWLTMKEFVNQEDFSQRVQNLEYETIIRDLQTVAYNHYVLIFMKYRAYKTAILWMKREIVVLAILAGITLLISIFNLVSRISLELQNFCVTGMP